MAIQIVMDRTGDRRHHFDPSDAQEVAKLERRFHELTNAGFTGLAGPVVRSARGRNHILS